MAAAGGLLFSALTTTGTMAVEPGSVAGQVASEPFAIDVVLDHPAVLVWDAITRKAMIDRYYFLPIGADMTGTGKEIFYGSPSNKLIVGIVLTIEPQRLPDR